MFRWTIMVKKLLSSPDIEASGTFKGREFRVEFASQSEFFA